LDIFISGLIANFPLLKIYWRTLSWCLPSCFAWVFCIVWHFGYLTVLRSRIGWISGTLLFLSFMQGKCWIKECWNLIPVIY